MQKLTCLFFGVMLTLITSCKKGINYTDSNIQWSKVYGGSGLDLAYEAVATSDGGYIVAGFTDSNDGDIQGKNHCATITDNTGKTHQVCGQDGWVFKLNSNGDTLWRHAYGGTDRLPFLLRQGSISTIVTPVKNSDRLTSIASSPDGGYLLAGQTNIIAPNRNQTYTSSFLQIYNPTKNWVIRINEQGTINAENIFEGEHNDSINCIKSLPGGQFVTAGLREYNKYFLFPVRVYLSNGTGILDYSPGVWDAFFIKGNFAGTTQFLPVGGEGYDKFNSIVQTKDNNFIAVGQTTSTKGYLTGVPSHGRNDLWIVKINSNGTSVMWTKTFGGEGDDVANAIVEIEDGNGGFIIAGQTNSNDGDITGNHSSNNDAWVIKIDSNGKLIWQKTYGGAFGDEMAKSIVQTPDGGFVIAGQTSSNDGDVSGNHGYSDAWVIKIDDNGKLLWQQTLGGSSADGATNVITTPDGGLLVTGYSFSNNGNISRSLANGNCWVVKLKKQ